MILVILGAGASYDSVPAKLPDEAAYVRERLPSRPPLADELFLDINPFAAALERFEDCHQIVTYLRKPDKGRTIEQKLELLRAEEADDPKRKRQLAAGAALEAAIQTNSLLVSTGMAMAGKRGVLSIFPMGYCFRTRNRSLISISSIRPLSSAPTCHTFLESMSSMSVSTSRAQSMEP